MTSTANGKGAAVIFATMTAITRLTTDDAQMLSKLGSVTLLQSHGHSAPAEVVQAYVDKAFSLQNCLKELADMTNIFHALFLNGQPVGYTKIIYGTAHPAIAFQNVTMMERLYLLDGVFQKGLGQELLEHAVHLSQAAGDQGMWLTVWQKNERAIRFYKKHGFDAVAEGRFVLTETHANPTWLMLLQY